MRTMVIDRLQNATLLNEGDLSLVPGHLADFLHDQRLSRSTWLTSPTTVTSSDFYNAGMYGTDTFGTFAFDDDIILDYDIGFLTSFNTLGIAGHNLQNYDIIISWSTYNVAVPDGLQQFVATETTDTIVLELDSTVSAQFVRIWFRNVLSSAPVLKLGRLGLGLRYQMPDMAPVINIDHISGAVRNFSDSRQLYGGPKYIYRRLSGTHPEIDAQSEVMDFFRIADIYNAIFVWWDEECWDEPPLYGAFSSETVGFNLNDARFYTVRWGVEEVF